MTISLFNRIFNYLCDSENSYIYENFLAKSPRAETFTDNCVLSTYY